MASLTDPVNNTTQWFYDHAGRVVEEKNALGASRYFAYTADGNLAQRTDRNGRVTEYAYDFLRRRTSETWLDGETAVRTFSFAYNLAGDLLTASDPAALYTYTYDNFGRALTITQEIDGLTPTVVMTQQYNLLGPRSQLATTIGGTADFQNAYTLDDFGRLLRITQSGATGGNAVAEKRVDFAYDAANQFTTITRYNNLAGTQLVAQSAHTFDGAGRLTALAHSKGATTLASHAWTWDAGSRITSYTNSADGSVTYSNDPASQLTGADYTYQPSIDDETYVYDANGNRTNNGYTVGVNNRLTSDGVNAYTYDAEGNRLTRTNETTGAVTEYAWDYRNRLSSVTERTSASGPSTKLVEHTYDHENRWLRRVVHPDGDVGSEPIGQTIFAYDGFQIVLHWCKTGSGDTAAANLSQRYVWGLNVDQILAAEQMTSLETTGNVLWPLCDHLNTVRDMARYDSDTDTTAVSNHRVYGAFGAVISETNAAVTCLFAFTARPFDREASVQNNLNRWYDSGPGLWLSEDRVGFTEGMNLYEYVKGHPASTADPTGEAAARISPFGRWGGWGCAVYLNYMVFYGCGKAWDAVDSVRGGKQLTQAEADCINKARVMVKTDVPILVAEPCGYNIIVNCEYRKADNDTYTYAGSFPCGQRTTWLTNIDCGSCSGFVHLMATLVHESEHKRQWKASEQGAIDQTVAALRNTKQRCSKMVDRGYCKSVSECEKALEDEIAAEEKNR